MGWLRLRKLHEEYFDHVGARARCQSRVLRFSEEATAILVVADA